MAAPTEAHATGDSCQNDPNICEIEATVITGFESVAKEDIEEKLGAEVKAGRGKVTLWLCMEKLPEILKLSCVDNLYIVLNHFENMDFDKNEEECMLELRRLVPKVNWKLGLKAWEKFYTFKNTISPEPQEKWQEFVKELEDGVIVAHDVQCDKPECDNNNSAVQEGDNEQSQTDNDTDVKQESEPPPSKVPRIRDPELPSFRVTCYRSGTHSFQSPQVAVHFGGTVQDYFGWNVNLKNFDVEIVISVEERHAYVSIALTRESRHRRHIEHFGSTTLRPTIAYNMLRMCHIQPGDIVCDPMCGGGSIPIEAALNWPDCMHLCGDLDEHVMKKAYLNVQALNLKRSAKQLRPLKVDVFSWDVTRLPMKTASVDVFITDMPFGKRSGSKVRNWHLYPKTLSEMARVVRPNTGRVCLLTQDKKCLTETLMNMGSYWRRGTTCWINIGGLSAGVYLLHRTAEMFK